MSVAPAVRERPIIFSGAMVRAILDGSKTQSRRVVNPQPFEYDSALEAGLYYPTVIARDECEEPGDEVFGVWSDDGDYAVRCPYGQPGDTLWVKEGFFDHGPLCGDPLTREERVEYRAEPWDRKCDGDAGGWTSAIYMPRCASRITLEITGVRVERVQDISEDDAIAEGQARHTKPPESISTVEMFAHVWDSLHAKKKGGAFAWANDPLVWVLSFTTVSRDTRAGAA